METKIPKLKRVYQLDCACCGQPTYGRQWWNQDCGYGLCERCIDIHEKDPHCEIELDFGYEGIHYNLDKNSSWLRHRGLDAYENAKWHKAVSYYIEALNKYPKEYTGPLSEKYKENIKHKIQLCLDMIKQQKETQ